MSQKLSDIVMIFSGNDARDVLQGQTTRNFKNAATGSALDGAFCDLKGRVIADFCAVITRDDQILMRTNHDLAHYLQGHLKKYLMFSKTELLLTDWSVYACKADSTVAANQSMDEQVVVSRDPNFIELWLEAGEPPEGTVNAAAYGADRLIRGEARLSSELIGKYLPQDLNYDLNGRIDFDKGCYTGQEIIARLHYRGEPKRRLRLFSLPPTVTPQAGDKIVNDADKPVGSVVECVSHGDEWLCLCESVLDIELQTLRIRGEIAHPSPLQRF